MLIFLLSAAMQLVNSLREQNIQITYEEVMNQANSQTKSLIISPSSPSSSSSSSSSPSSPSSSSEDLFSLEKEFEKITRIVEQNSLGYLYFYIFWIDFDLIKNW